MVTLRNVHYYAVLCPNAISQKAALAALMGPQYCVTEMVNEYARRRKLALGELAQIKSLTCNTPEGAFYVFPDFSEYEKSDETLAMNLLREARVVTAPGSGFGDSGKGHLRISYSAPYEQVKEGLERIARYLQT
jgi:aspartate/methionine/tyrosine aminotransferase